MKNKYGVDTNYFQKELKLLSENLDNKTQEELYQHLLVLANTVEPDGNDT